MAKIYTIEKTRRGRTTKTSGTIAELTKYFGYTLEVGNSWDKKIKRNPKTIKSLVSNLNSAKAASAANGCSDTYYDILKEDANGN